MYDTATRVGLVKSRVRQKQQRWREKRVLHVLSLLCLVLAVSLAGTIGMFAGFGHTAALSMYGSILLHEGAGGYVLVGVIAFVAAVVITLSCIRYSEKSKKNRCRDMEKKDSGKD